ncbi:MAG: iron-sulfur cluster assembly accessory protein [Gammaproteobacteria bacterium]|nr:iron-sulfur cluster assembly accessory protein [Gammaproteobacteria bacterium]
MSAFPQTIDQSVINVTPAAAEKLTALMAGADDDILGVRIFVSGGGCNGMDYGMTFTERCADHDVTMKGEGYNLLVDAVTLNFMRGAEIDYANSGVNTSFIFNNAFAAVGGSGGCTSCSSSQA